MAARRGKSQARRNTSNGTPGWVWLVAGVAIAAVVFLAAPNLFKKDGDGFLRVGPRANPDAQPEPVADADVDTPAELPKPSAQQPSRRPNPALRRPSTTSTPCCQARKCRCPMPNWPRARVLKRPRERVLRWKASRLRLHPAPALPPPRRPPADRCR